SAVSKLAGWIGGKLVAAFHVLGRVGTAVWNGIESLGKSALNGMISLINGVIHAINALIHAWNILPFHHDVGTIGTIPKLAAGGTLTSSGLVTVGERGPETVMLPRGASVMPLGRSGGAPLVGNLTINRVHDDREAVRELTRTLRRLRLLHG